MTKQQSCPYDRHCRLRNHIKRHQGFKGFRCDQCDRGYYGRHALTRHVAVAPHQRRHRPLICDHCRQSFINAWALRRHLQHYDVVDDGQRAEGRFKWPVYQQQVWPITTPNSSSVDIVANGFWLSPESNGTSDSTCWTTLERRPAAIKRILSLKI